MRQNLRTDLEFAMVDGHKLHVFRAGCEGAPKLVLMSGSGTIAPVYDFKVLYQELLDQFRIIVIEKFGYGYSDLHECPCSIDSAISLQRRALEQLGESGPYVLAPHSVSGLEAIRWRQLYPGEVAAIIGLDMAVPATYLSWSQDDINRRIAFMRRMRRLNSLGLLFWYPLNTRGLSRDEARQQRLLLRRNAMNVCMENEARAVLENARTVDGGSKIDCPMLMFVSDGSQVSPGWTDRVHEFATSANAREVLLSCGHYVHHFESERICAEIRAFVSERLTR